MAEFTVTDAVNTFRIQRYSLDISNNYSLESRLSLAVESLDESSNPDQIRLVLSPETTNNTRWMTAGGVGTFLELNSQASDFIRENLILDRDEVVSQIEISDRYANIYALSIDGQGGNSWGMDGYLV